MMTTITPEMTRHIIRELLTDGGNHRLAVFEQTNRQFLDYALDFFDRARQSKIRWEESQAGSVNWYAAFLREHTRDKEELQIIGGIPGKTITNIYGRATREVVLEAALGNIAHLSDALEELTALRDLGAAPAIVLDDGFSFTHEESILLINSLAVKRQQISAGNWASVGMATEVPLLRSLCMLYQLDERYHRGGVKKDNRYQVDYMLQHSGREQRCEVKLNGRGNPESVTAAIGRNPSIVLADYISDQNREKLDVSQIAWVSFSDAQGFRRFGGALDRFGIPYTEPQNLDQLDDILDRVLPLP